MLEKLCKLSAKLIILQEIISSTILILFLGITDCITLLIFYPLTYLLKCLSAISVYVNEQSGVYSERLKEIYETLRGKETK